MINRKDAKAQKERKEFWNIEQEFFAYILCVFAPLRFSIWGE